jgi:hypothetical protein
MNIKKHRGEYWTELKKSVMFWIAVLCILAALIFQNVLLGVAGLASLLVAKYRIVGRLEERYRKGASEKKDSRYE